MRNTLKLGLIAFITFAGFAAAPAAMASNSPSGINGGGINTPSQWVPNDASGTITPNPNTLQIPCANIVGGCGSGGGISTSTANTFTAPQTVSSSLTVTGPTLVNSIQNIYYFPTPAQLGAGTTCGNAINTNEVGTCMMGFYNGANGSSTEVIFGPYSYASSTWTTQWNFNTQNKYILVVGAGANGTRLVYTGVSQSIIVLNEGDNNNGFAAGIAGLRVLGNGSTTSTCIFAGGSQGAQGQMIVDNSFSGCGTIEEENANTYGLLTADNIFTVTATGTVIDAAANAGERQEFIGNLWATNVSDITPMQCVVIRNAATPGAFFALNSFDGACGVTVGANDYEVSFDQDYWENANQVSTPNIPPFDFLSVANSTSTSWSITNSSMQQDATSTEFITAGASGNISGLAVSRNNVASTSARFITMTSASAELTTSGITPINNPYTTFTNATTSISTTSDLYVLGQSQFAGHLVFATGTPTASDGFVSGSDQFGFITITTSSAATGSSTLIFATPFNGTTTCVATASLQGSATSSSNIVRQSRTTPTSSVFTDASPFATGTTISYFCAQVGGSPL